ncbi:unnamed protein product [Acanthoscelides obtectus]|uniref:Uncharacterized protein n=1 Tax=Acanthoscelides obtectus TaxID=200917 RepID=A0A9P0LSU8_ACAOB|nr:unnamed protein product [Acanthoscelides obtectus]CAK1651377.1 hypothetical protein AOBTE_LOCUS17235 [Acanthoscelides obtectus]
MCDNLTSITRKELTQLYWVNKTKTDDTASAKIQRGKIVKTKLGDAPQKVEGKKKKDGVDNSPANHQRVKIVEIGGNDAPGRTPKTDYKWLKKPEELGHENKALCEKKIILVTISDKKKISDF